MPNRIIKESARTSETLDLLSDAAERMFWRLLTVADDFGRFEANPKVLLAACFPLRVDRLKVPQIEAWVGELRAASLIFLYERDGKRYGFLRTFEKHQGSPRARKSKYPPPPADTCEQMPASADRCPQMPANVPVFESESVSVSEFEVTTLSGSQSTSASASICAQVSASASNGNGHSPLTAKKTARLLREQATEVLNFLNTKTGKQFRLNATNLGLIEARLKGGATPDNCRGVIARKARQWGDDPKMREYLRPETLFNRTKFESYLGERLMEPRE